MKEFNRERIGRMAMIVVFLALIRIVGEFFRLEYTLKDQLTIGQLNPYMAGAMLCAVSCLIMVILSFYARHTWIITIAVLTVAGLVALKYIYIL